MSRYESGINFAKNNPEAKSQEGNLEMKNQTDILLEKLDKYKTPHIKARTESPSGYPKRFIVPDDKVFWDIDFPEYNPQKYVAPVVLANSQEIKSDGWADPEKFDPIKPIYSFEGEIKYDKKSGLPLNPLGRTGIADRGLLGKWGPNHAADPIITRENPITGKNEILAIRRKDNNEWAIPGGMVDPGENITKTLARELEEETGIKLNWQNAKRIYEGYVDDPRNTDNAWMETVVAHLHLSSDEANKLNPHAGDDAVLVSWQEINDEFLKSMYASHGEFVKAALKKMQEPEV